MTMSSFENDPKTICAEIKNVACPLMVLPMLFLAFNTQFHPFEVYLGGAVNIVNGNIVNGNLVFILTSWWGNH